LRRKFEPRENQLVEVHERGREGQAPHRDVDLVLERGGHDPRERQQHRQGRQRQHRQPGGRA
jgi:hypothetical protein